MGGLLIDDRSRLRSERGRRSIGDGRSNRVHSLGTQKVQGSARGATRSGTGGGDR